MKMPKRLFEKNDCNQKTDESHLIDQEFHLLAFQHRENNFSICSKANKKLIDSGLDPYDAFNIVQHQMIDVASYLERVVLSSFKRPYRTLKTK
jgi:acyl-CoA oxidase